MNRLNALLQPTPPEKSTAERAGRWPGAGDHELFIPLHYESRYAYPLLVWIGDAERLSWVMKNVSIRNYVAVSPRGAGLGRGDWEERVFAAIHATSSRLNVARQRIFVAGAGSCGTEAIRLAMSHPEWFAGAASLGGAFPEGAALARWDDVRGRPLLLAVGKDAEDYNVTRACEDLRLIHASGMELCFRAYPGQRLLPPALADLDRWIMERIQIEA